MFLLDTPNFNIQIRLVNFPALTNVVLGINYMWELSSSVECMTTDAQITTYLPRPGAAATTFGLITPYETQDGATPNKVKKVEIPKK